MSKGKMRKHQNLPMLNVLIKADMLVRDPNTPDILSDVDIFKSFNLPVMDNEDIYENSTIGRLLKERLNRPSRDTWMKFMKTAEDCGLGATDAADLYFHYLDKQTQEPIDIQPNITGSSIDGLGLSADEDKEKKPCD